MKFVFVIGGYWWLGVVIVVWLVMDGWILVLYGVYDVIFDVMLVDVLMWNGMKWYGFVVDLVDSNVIIVLVFIVIVYFGMMLMLFVNNVVMFEDDDVVIVDVVSIVVYYLINVVVFVVLVLVFYWVGVMGVVVNIVD